MKGLCFRFIDQHLPPFMCEEITHLLYNAGICFVYHIASITRVEVFLVKFCFLKWSTYIFTNKCRVAIYPWVTISILYVHIYTCIDASMNNELWKCVHKDIERDNTWQWAVNALSFPWVRDNCIIHEWQRKVTSVNCIWAT